MKEYEGKQVKILVLINDKFLNYNGRLTRVDEHHITFIDKFGKFYTYHKEQIKEICEK